MFVHILIGLLVFVAMMTPRIYGQACDVGDIFAAGSSMETGRTPTSVESGDLNNDGFPDIVTANSADGDVSVFLSNGDGTLGARSDFAANLSPLSCAIGDIDADGFLDIVVANSDLLNIEQVSVLFNQGDGTFGLPVSYQTGAFPQSVQVVDLNNDGYLDIATANPSDNSISVLLNILGVTFLEYDKYDVDALFPVDIASGDVDGDGDVDLVSANFNSGSIRVMRNNGSGSFSQSQRVILGNDTSGLELGDLDGDGDLDLIVVNADEFSPVDVVILKNSGVGVFSSAQFIALDNNDSSEAYKVSLADADGDGDLDFVTADGNNNTVSIGINTGNAVYSTPFSLPVGEFARDVYFADINDDGRPDLFEVDRDSQAVNMFLNICKSTSCLADFNNDGHLNFFDVSAFLDALAAQDPASDITGDGHFNFFDVSAFLTAFAAGCP